MHADETSRRVKRLMIENISRAGSWDDVDDDYPLLGKQVIDSLGMLKLVSALEQEFDIEIDDEDVVPDHWRTIRHIAALVDAKRAPAQ